MRISFTAFRLHLKVELSCKVYTEKFRENSYHLVNLNAEKEKQRPELHPNNLKLEQLCNLV